MDPNAWNLTARVIATLAGVIFGSVAVSCASWVWLRRQIFAYGGTTLCVSGVILIGLSIWHSVKFGANGGSVNLELSASNLKSIENIVSMSIDRSNVNHEEDIKSILSAAIKETMSASEARFGAEISKQISDMHRNEMMSDWAGKIILDKGVFDASALKTATLSQLILKYKENNFPVVDLQSKEFAKNFDDAFLAALSKQQKSIAFVPSNPQ